MAQRTSLAGFRSNIKIGRRNAGCAFAAVKEGESRGAVDALLGRDIVNLLVGTENTGILGEIEVFGRVALDAVGLIPVKLVGTAAGFINYDHAALASLAVSACIVPDGAFRAFSAFSAVEVGRFIWTRNALLVLEGVDVVICADFAFVVSVVEVARVVTFSAQRAIEKESLILTFALVRGRIVDTANAANLACKSGTVVEGPRRAFSAAVILEEGLFGGTKDALVEIKVIYSVSRTGNAQFAIEVEVFWQIAFNALLLCEEGLCHWAFTRILLLVVVPTARASLASLNGHVKVEISWTCFAAVRCENGLVGGASHAGLQVGIVEEVFLAILAHFVLVVEVFRQVAGDAAIASLKGLGGRTDALLD